MSEVKEPILNPEVVEETKPEDIKPEQREIIVRKTMEADSSGVLVPKDITEAYKYAAMIHKSNLAPASFDSPEKILVAMQTARELGINPLTSLRSMYIVNGVVNLWGDLPLALVRRSGLMEDFTETQYDSNGLDMNDEKASRECDKAVCRIKRRGENEIVKTITWAEVQAAGLDKNKWGTKDTYKNHRRRMMMMRVRTEAIKDGFGDVIQGIAIYEYDDYEKKERVVSGDVARLNEKYNLGSKDVGTDE